MSKTALFNTPNGGVRALHGHGGRDAGFFSILAAFAHTFSPPARFTISGVHAPRALRATTAQRHAVPSTPLLSRPSTTSFFSYFLYIPSGYF